MKRLALILAGGLLAAGCLVDVQTVSNPDRAFDEARHHAERAAHRGGRAHEVHLLAYDRDDGQLVRVSLPIEVVLQHDDDDDFDAWIGNGKARRQLRSKDLAKARPGLLLEVDEGDGEQVMIWLQ